MRTTLLAVVALVALIAACGDAADPSLAPAQTVAPTTTAPPITEPPPTTTTTVPAVTGTVPSTTAPPTTTTTVPPTTVPPTTVPEEGAVAIDISVREGEVEAVERVPVTIGDEVTITVDADVSDEVHLHGYDLFADVAPGMPAVMAFVADIPGIFEVEMENSRLLLVELVVEP